MKINDAKDAVRWLDVHLPNWQIGASTRRLPGPQRLIAKTALHLLYWLAQEAIDAAIKAVRHKSATVKPESQKPISGGEGSIPPVPPAPVQPAPPDHLT